MTMRSTSRWVLVCLLAVAGCGGDDDAVEAHDDGGVSSDGAPAVEGDAASDAGSQSTTATALMIALVGRQMGFGVLTIHDDGTVTDTGTRLDSPGRPRAVAFAADRRTALAAYGSAPWEKRGVLVISLEPDGSEAEVIQDLRIQTEQSPTDILMTGEGEAVMSLVGPDAPDALLSVRRNGDDWELGPSVPCSPGPDQLRDIGVDGQALLVRLSLFDGVSAVTAIARREDGGWQEVAGSGIDWSDKQYAYDVAVTSSGDRAYRTYTVRPHEDNPSGTLATLERDADSGGWSEKPGRVPFPDFSLELDLSPADDLLVLFDENHHALETLAIDAGGAITPLADRTALDAIYEMEFSPWGALVVAVSGLEDSLHTYRRGDDSWIETASMVLDDPFVDVWIAQPR